MLDHLPRLRPSRPELAPALLPIVFGWVTTYADKPDPDILDLAIWALRSLAQELDDPSTSTGWFSIALAYVGKCRPHDRQRLLTAWWPDELRTHPAWVTTALATAAAPELADYYNQRHEPLLQELMDRPDLLTGVPFARSSRSAPSTARHTRGVPWNLSSSSRRQAAGLTQSRWPAAWKAASRPVRKAPAGRRLAGADRPWRRAGPGPRRGAAGRR